MPENGPYPGKNDRKRTIYVSISIERTVIVRGRSFLIPNKICSENLLNFFSDFKLWYFLRYETHKNLFIEEMLEMFAVWINFALARFDQWARSLRQRVACFYADFNGIFENFTRRLFKICKWTEFARWKEIQSHRSFILICFAAALWKWVAPFHAESQWYS